MHNDELFIKRVISLVNDNDLPKNVTNQSPRQQIIGNDLD